VAGAAFAINRSPKSRADRVRSRMVLCYDDAIILEPATMQHTFDRAAEDLGNSIHLEHVNVRIPDQRLATLFYAAGLGLTRDPMMMVGDGNMWINVGRSQFHLPTGNAQVLRGHTGIVIAGRAALLDRLAAVRARLAGTRFGFSERDDHVEATCPWGNWMRCYEPDLARFGAVNLGIPYVEFDVPVGTVNAIAEFYRRMIEAPAWVGRNETNVARVMVGRDQYLLFRETDRPLPEFDDHHVQIYLVNFSGPHRRLRERNLISQEDNRYQYRFRDIIDLDTGRHLYTVEHEVRSITHPMYLRPLVNRNPMMTNRNYAPGYDQLPWSVGPEHYD
jgi:hypothetical protein